MSLDKAIKYRKEKRKPYYKSGRFDRTCRNHGSCPYCERNRTIQGKKEESRLEGQEDEFFGYWFQPDPSDVDMDLTEEILPKFGYDAWDFKQLEDMENNWQSYLDEDYRKNVHVPEEYDCWEEDHFGYDHWSLEEEWNPYE